MLKPAEKIESIRINHITGLGTGASSGGNSGGNGSSVNQVVDGVLSMALQLPAVKKLGEEVGLNIADGVSGLSRSINNDKPDGSKPETGPAAKSGSDNAENNDNK